MWVYGTCQSHQSSFISSFDTIKMKIVTVYYISAPCTVLTLWTSQRTSP